ncbi:MFS transporter [Solicola gregarius]|uniref:MFS transporter n=1 Tax=Solicola gregarius TaxID=2908642 RepID=A0AA46YNG6_9ACTN|nr:MFS transporter [Solicola gregarius]UYM06688.1 MFS transporter [Solicola gregarius]
MGVVARLGRVATDIRPLRRSPDFRRLWFGLTVAQLGQQMTGVTIAYQVYVLTHSSYSVGLVGLYGLVPLIAFGLYGGALVDAYDRRRVALVASAGLWICSGVLVMQAVLDWESVGLLYALVALQSACFAVNSPARSAIIPRLLPAELLPAANALSMASFNLGFTIGPLTAGVLIAWHGVEVTYAVDAVTFTAAMYALLRLPAVPPLNGPAKAPGLRSVVDGLRFLRTAPNLRMTFVLDLCAMVLAQPRALFPALALTVYGGNASTLGLLQASPAIGSLLAFLVSGWIGRVHRHGVAVVVAIVAYAMAVALAGFAAIGLPGLVVLGVVCFALSGSADMISSSYRSTILQSATPDALRGRLQGVFTVVVAGGPRLGDFVIGASAGLFGEPAAMAIGGCACIAAVLIVVATRRRFLAYDSRHPTP